MKFSNLNYMVIFYLIVVMTIMGSLYAEESNSNSSKGHTTDYDDSASGSSRQSRTIDTQLKDKLIV